MTTALIEKLHCAENIILRLIISDGRDLSRSIMSRGCCTMANQRQAVEIPEQYIALIDLDFGFSQEELKIFRSMWKVGESVFAIAEELERDPDEIAILVMDQARKGRIKQRPRGVFG